MVTDGANVLSVRSRTTRSSKGKASPMLSLVCFDIQSDIFFSLLSSSSPSHVLPTSPFPLVPHLRITSSFPTQMQTHNNSRNNSVSLVSTRLTQLATEIAFFARSQTSCTVPSPATSNFERTFVTGSSHIVCDTHLLLTTNAVWMFTFPSCVNLVRPPTHTPLCSILRPFIILRYIRRPSRTFRIYTYEEVQRKGHPTRSCLSHRVGRWLGRRHCGEGHSHVIVVFLSHNPGRAGTHPE